MLLKAGKEKASAGEKGCSMNDNKSKPQLDRNLTID